jgi:proteasome lid subunit RPN8/RPN11
VKDQTELLESSVAPAQALFLAGDIAEEIIAHLREALPREGCGLLAVRRGVDGAAVATRFYPGTNLDASPTRYTMDPAEVLAAHRDIEANAWILGAIVHSHPATSPAPSPTDLREAYYPEALMVIVSFAAGLPRMRAWRLVPTRPARIAAEIPILTAMDV